LSDQLSDDRLRELLRSRDPAAALPPADPGRVARLLEDAMSPSELSDVETPTHDLLPEKADPRRRTPLTWLVAAAAVLVIAGVGAFAVFGGEEEPARVPNAIDERGSVLELRAAPPTQGRCAMVTAERLASSETAFEGTVTSVEGRRVSLRVDRWYRGGDADVVDVTGPSESFRVLLDAVSFEKDGRYLVSATDGAVSVCGFSAAYSDELAAIYAEAFAS
jgi:hypothetical protein